MYGKALGIEVITDADAGDEQFTANDLNGDWDRTGATQITLARDGGSVKGSGSLRVTAAYEHGIVCNDDW